MEGRAWWATVHRVTQSQTQLKSLSRHGAGGGDLVANLVSDFCHPIHTFTYLQNFYRDGVSTLPIQLTFYHMGAELSTAHHQHLLAKGFFWPPALVLSLTLESWDSKGI